MRDLCGAALITAEGGFAQYKALFDRLRATFDVGVLNLNYDTALLTAWLGAFTGFGAEGQFDPGVARLASNCLLMESEVCHARPTVKTISVLDTSAWAWFGGGGIEM
jgi:hypothetical protein